VAARFGGEEFAVLLADTPLDQAAALAEGFRAALMENPLATSIGPVSVTVSIGIAERSQSSTPRTLLQRADGALYGAKSHGRNRVTLA
jgi:diguanylate cyclase (GGDEF)-like protein